MIGKYFKCFDTGGNPVFVWGCDCEKCKNTTSPCMNVLELNILEEKQNKKEHPFLLGL